VEGSDYGHILRYRVYQQVCGDRECGKPGSISDSNLGSSK